VSTQQIARITKISTGFELGFGEREATPEPAMKLGIQPHMAGLSLSASVFSYLTSHVMLLERVERTCDTIKYLHG
jgi:hypothetical protein